MSSSTSHRLRPMRKQPLLQSLFSVVRSIVLTVVEYTLSWLSFAFGWKKAELRGKVAIVTGAAGGIGIATAELLAESGCTVVLTDISNDLDSASAKLEAKGYKIASYRMDVTKPDESRKVVAEVARRFGRVDIFVSNAGVVHGKSLLELTDQQIATTFDVNTLGTIYSTRAVLPQMLKQSGGGHIVSVISLSACGGVAYLTDYAASKHACYGFYESLEDELRRMGSAGAKVRLSMLFPTVLDASAGLLKRVPLRAVTTNVTNAEDVAQEIASAIRYNRRFVCVPNYFSLLFMIEGLAPRRIVFAFQDLFGANLNRIDGN